MEDILLFFRGIGGLIVLVVAGYFVGVPFFHLFTIKSEDNYHNFIFKLVLGFIFLAIITGIIGIILELANN